ncbi:hypothetical protein [Nonomuraea soli]|uniref:Uncharacterized protein n=1 Tax=Nonomuraea soli TaxID=1032476 RepID=A0A7W0CQH3_9ACTN|nr:hypothetical protein [Nonomuraea soli]MBA2895489.1 hypothetical protein [Nonomuraea soli]
MSATIASQLMTDVRVGGASVVVDMVPVQAGERVMDEHPAKQGGTSEHRHVSDITSA